VLIFSLDAFLTYLFLIISQYKCKPQFVGKERQFRKFTSFEVSDLGVGYDYASVMHYSRRAFSKNGMDTIIPKVSAKTARNNSHSLTIFHYF